MDTTKTTEQRVADLYRRIDLLTFGLVCDLGLSSSALTKARVQDRISEIINCRRELDQVNPNNLYRVNAIRFPWYKADVTNQDTGLPATVRVFPHEKNAARVLNEWADRHSVLRTEVLDAALDTYVEMLM